ncbi:MAG TPA: sigma-54 dependent transcriptional regulator [Thermoanaerobaculia bacterium]|jgi:DNA-binding NtrC family response regulator|nr:sigma-54 dependent transcriptional regulator [Thermoanaerobaculia bacterium]
MTTSRAEILLVDDEAAIRFGVGDFLASKGFAVREAATATEALAAVEAARPDAMVIDYRLPDGDALGVIPRVREIDPRIFIVLLTAHGSIELAVEAVKAGAEQFLTKPVDLDTLLVVLRRGLESRRHRQRQIASERLESRRELRPFLGDSNAVRALERGARKLAAADSPVLLLGETGTGKRELARWLHDNGPRAGGPFADLNCAGLSRQFLESELFGHERDAFRGAGETKIGLLELANRGTVFLDEIGDVHPEVQPELLQVLEDGHFRRVGGDRDLPVDVRLVVATRHDLGQMARENRFCTELYFRINTIPLHLPPLRERRQDIPMLAEELVEELADDFGRRAMSLTPRARRVLQAYDWPGNLRELRNILERAVLLTENGYIDADDLCSIPASAHRGPVARPLGPYLLRR